ncbi:MAG: SDR family oxidoreductase [Rhodospirillaceae bacterium]
MIKLFCFGLGFSALALARRVKAQGWSVAGTCRTEGKAGRLTGDGIEAHVFDGSAPMANAIAALDGVTHVLISIPPTDAGDPVIRHHAGDLRIVAGSVDWVGYLSTTGVYGNTDGAEVTEASPRNPSSARSVHRAKAEDDWLKFGGECGLPVHVFRLAGIYGSGRSTIDQVQAGQARRIEKPGHLFSRIHVEDIAGVLDASIRCPDPGAAYNVCDDEAAAQSDVVAFTCGLLGIDPPPLVAFDDAKTEMSPMALSFWNDNRIVRNDRMKNELGVSLTYPTYREGLRAIFTATENQ